MIDPTLRLESLDYFAQTGYSELELQNYLRTIVLTSVKSTSLVDDSAISLLSPGSSLYYYFGINCLKEKKFLPGFCETMVQEMLDVMPVYDISKDYDSLQSIAEELAPTSFKAQFCDNVRQYLFFSNDTSDKIKLVMSTCWPEYEESYNDFAWFRTVQSQLDNQFVNSIVTPSALLNAYKLVSIQQTIYNELSAGKFNSLRIKSYAKYIEELLRRKAALQNFYFDSIAVYNNQYLIPELTKIFLKSRSQDKETKDLLENLRVINEGSSLVWYEGLVSLVSNLNLISLSSLTIISSPSQEKPLDVLFRETNSFENFIVRSEKLISPDSVEVRWSFTFGASDKVVDKNLQSILTMKYNGQKFVISAASFPSYPVLTENVTSLFSTNTELTLAWLYDQLRQDSLRFNTKLQSICDIIKGASYLKSCSSTTVVVKSMVTGAISYTINHNNGVLNSYSISSQSFQQAMLDSLWTPSTTDSTLVLFIDKLINYIPTLTPVVPVTTKTITGTAEALQVREDFSNLWVEVLAVAEVSGLYSVQFIFKNIQFIAAYDLSKQTILWLALVSGTAKTPIRSFVLNLSDSSSQDVVFFRTDPQWFVAQKDPLAAQRFFK